MNILVIGSGGREHALCWAMAKSRLVGRLFCAPGNAGIAETADCPAIDIADHAAVIEFSRVHEIDLVVIGPEQPLVNGLADDLRQAGIHAFGPGRAAARLEGSKAFTKEICDAYGIPTAAWARFDTAGAARAYLQDHRLPVVIKADGLAAGKGVIIAETLAEAEAAVEAMFAGAFGAAGAELVIEEFLEGEEISFFALSDGETVLPLGGAQDHKRVGDGDTGPNTGGMGAYSPTPLLDRALRGRIMDKIILPTVAALKDRGTPFQGVLFAGLMITQAGPKLIEYNVRFGDPECQVLMARLASDIVPALHAVAAGDLGALTLAWKEESAVTVVMATEGYPGDYRKGSEIKGLEDAARVEDVLIFHAGTRRDGDRLLADGGRVLNVTATGRDIREARDRAYAAIDRIDWPQGFCRRDIGWRAVKRLE